MAETETILVVDDELPVLSVVQVMLTHQGYRAIVASSGSEAIRLLEAWQDLALDLALIDVIMPEMSGIETAERVRQLRPQLPILLMSGFADNRKGWPESARNLPIIPKPFTAFPLAQAIREILGEPRTASA